MSPHRRVIRTWLAREEKTQRWLAARVGVSEAQLSLVLTGKRTLSAELHHKLFAATGVRLRRAKRAAVSTAA